MTHPLDRSYCDALGVRKPWPPGSEEEAPRQNVLTRKDSLAGAVLSLSRLHNGLWYFWFLCINKLSFKFISGSIVVKVASSLQAHLQLSGKEVDVNSEVHVQEMAEARKENGVIITGKEAIFYYLRWVVILHT